MALTVFEEEFLNYGKVLYISNGLQEMRVTIDVGPRIISYNLVGFENFMCCDLDRKTQSCDEEFKAVFGKDKAWYLYGGHRFWVSPEEYPLTYDPDNDPVKYTVDGNVFTFVNETEPVSGWQKTTVVVFDENSATVTVKHILTNNSAEEKTGSIWALSVTDKGNVAFVPQCRDKTGFVPNRSLVMWDYTDLSDGRFIAGKDHYVIKQQCGHEEPFKIGVNNTDGKILALNHGQLFKVEFDYRKNALYPDFGSTTEIYTCDFMTELETLSPLYTFAPGQSYEHAEKWTLCEEKSTNLDEVVKQL